MTWLCSCGLVNSGLNESGSCAKAFNDRREHIQISENKPDFWQALVASKGIYMTPQEELFAKFYNQEKLLVKDMDLVMLREHRDELAAIAFQAKARLVAIDDETKERNVKTKNKEWLTTVDTSKPDSDAVNAVRVRAARMSKMDKLRHQLLTAGIDEETVNEMVKNMERKATEKDVKAITFNKPTVEQAVVVVQASKPVDNNGESKPAFDPTSLKFGSK